MGEFKLFQEYLDLWANYSKLLSFWLMDDGYHNLKKIMRKCVFFILVAPKTSKNLYSF
jgi:hypothetical protein